MMTRIVLAAMGILGRLPLPWLRAIGHLFGLLLYVLVKSRRQVVWVNLQMCFPHWPQDKVRACARQVFVHFMQAWLDRGWLWHGDPELVRTRLRLTGSVDELAGDVPTVLFAPHFVGLDAGWTALTQQLPRIFGTIYSTQVNRDADDWILAGRQRFGQSRLIPRLEGVKPVVSVLRSGGLLYLLPDMGFDPSESLWVPFYGISTATVPSLSRFARLGRAKVVPVVTSMTPEGYDVQVMPAWEDYPSGDLEGDTALMNLRLQGFIDSMPSQYYWVHKRFKDRPGGANAPY
jgi:KDO2-lipid IV(A) lauroyltransferase